MENFVFDVLANDPISKHFQIMWRQPEGDWPLWKNFLHSRTKPWTCLYYHMFDHVDTWSHMDGLPLPPIKALWAGIIWRFACFCQTWWLSLAGLLCLVFDYVVLLLMEAIILFAFFTWRKMGGLSTSCGERDVGMFHVLGEIGALLCSLCANLDDN